MASFTSAECPEIEAYNSSIDIYTLPIFTRSQLSRYNGQDKPQLFVAINGYIFDVTSNSKNYGAGKSYHKLVGKDSSRLLGLNRLQLSPNKDASNNMRDTNTWDTSDFTEKQHQSLEKWLAFFKKRYKIVGIVIDHQFQK